VQQLDEGGESEMKRGCLSRLAVGAVGKQRELGSSTGCIPDTPPLWQGVKPVYVLIKHLFETSGLSEALLLTQHSL
jgi:hypothetical protein